MQKGLRFNESQLLYLAGKAKHENTICGNLYKKSSDTGKWQLRYFILYQNVLFYYENDSSIRPSGAALLEGSYCDRVITPATGHKGKEGEKLHCFTITYKSEGQRQYDLRSDSEGECNAWIDAIKRASYSKMVEVKEELEQKHLHLLQILDSERQAKWHYVQQTEELTTEVKKLKAEVQKFKKEIFSNHKLSDEETDEIRKIKKVSKVQSFFRGWLCRRRWKQIVELYIRSPHAESMRKRNSIVFSMVECEEEYNRQLSCLVTYFLRPLRMAASSKKPPITHEDVNSIFLNSETLLFLHQIFQKGLTARLENWPTLVLGDLFDMLLPMLSIYQEYVRNHHYSLQVLAEYKQKPEFNCLLKRYEEKPACEGRTLEIFLTYPMHQIPRYIITLHELLAHTPHEHVERRSLEFAKSKLEELSRIMHDEVSETENIRKNLAIERMIVEGCDILLDVNQTFVRQGPLLQILNEKSKSSRGRLGSFSSSFKETKKEVVRQIFLFTNHMLLTTRASSGRLHLAKHYGKIPLLDCTLVEDPNSDIFFFDEDTSSLDSNLSIGSQTSVSNLLPTVCEREAKVEYNGLDFRLIVDSKSGPPISLLLVATSLHEKAAWCSDISQCIENLHYSDLLNSSMSESSSVTMPQSVRYIHNTQIWSDPKLFRDDVDIKFSRTLNSCKVPQIRHASVDRLLDRLTDLRFLSIDFLNTFLLTYRVFTNGQTLLEALKKVYKNPDTGNLEAGQSAGQSDAEDGSPPHMEFTGEPPCIDSKLIIKPQAEKMRRVSAGVVPCSGETHIEKPVVTSISFKLERTESVDSDDSCSELSSFLQPQRPKLAPIASCETLFDSDQPDGMDVPAITMDELPNTVLGTRGSAEAESISMSTPRSSFAQIEGSPPRAKAGTVVTSSRASKRRSSSSAATTAFAAATAGLASCSNISAEHSKNINRYLNVGTGVDARPFKKRESVISTAATMRVLNVLKHWVSKHQQDFESDPDLKCAVIDLLEEMVCNTNLLPAEHKAAASILRTITKDTSDLNIVDLDRLLIPPMHPSKDTFDTLAAMDIAEQLTYLDHQIFMGIRSEELLCQAWMKPDKCHRAPHVLLVSKRFNEVSRLVVSEIVSRSNLQDRVTCIEKWAAIADICRCMHNYNGVLQICAAFVNSSVYRLKKTWEKVPKQTKQMIERLQTLVSSEGRFKNMRDALHRCDPPCIPYLGMYLTDLSFIEEGTPNFTEERLVNFSKMRMVAHVIREIKLFQQTSYKIEHHPRVTSYLLDTSRLLDEEQTYRASLDIEPKQSRLSVVSAPS
ncbi:ras-specific guanine nucleotide-releasing factor 2-like isoform X7 [Gigantopelta aegis]|uniref:ras-specific guanine nucleotide-releasing factor 2-like isoform X7 n=1 Tax=Gigantopelta aegis TaxID=1735272 RepID=UPI001B8884F2|nr:ras-specific guanine nucleotide-releasing factor 2-like isoform X7 [Gigantopelta aegis]